MTKKVKALTPEAGRLQFAVFLDSALTSAKSLTSKKWGLPRGVNPFIGKLLQLGKLLQFADYYVTDTDDFNKVALVALELNNYAGFTSFVSLRTGRFIQGIAPDVEGLISSFALLKDYFPMLKDINFNEEKEFSKLLSQWEEAEQKEQQARMEAVANRNEANATGLQIDD